MKINFTKRQFRTLLDLVYVGDFIINGIREHDEQIKEYEEIIQYVYSFAKKMGCGNLVKYSREYDEYHETREFEESLVYELIEEYDDYVFWEELVSRLAKRDVGKEIEEIDDISHDEVVKMLWSREEIYEKEFYKNGLDNIRVEDI